MTRHMPDQTDHNVSIYHDWVGDGNCCQKIVDRECELAMNRRISGHQNDQEQDDVQGTFTEIR